MIYLAIVLIIAGIFFLWKALKESEANIDGKVSRLGTSQKKQRGSTPRQISSRDRATLGSQTTSGTLPAGIPSQRIRKIPNMGTASNIYQKKPQVKQYQGQARPKPRMSEISERTSPPPLPIVKFSINGALYIDEKQSISRAYAKNSGVQINNYKDIHRIGVAVLNVQGDIFMIHSDNTSYRYEAKHLDQIIFQESGVAFIPRKSRQAAAIFLTETEQVERIRLHIKNSSSNLG